MLDSSLPVIAVTSIPNLDKRPTAIDPTPPVAPDTATGNSGASIFDKTASTLAAAVIPAVPNEIASSIDKLLGNGTTQPDGT